MDVILSKGSSTPDLPNASKSPIIVADLMAGVGPFSIPLAMHFQRTSSSSSGSKVFANDLNPASYQYLTANAIKNHCTSSSLACFNLDARAFVTHLNEQNVIYTDVIMNLPQSAVEFLDVFRNHCETRREIRRRLREAKLEEGKKEENDEEGDVTWVHVYGFSSAIDPVEDIVQRIASTLQCSVSSLGKVTMWSKGITRNEMMRRRRSGNEGDGKTNGDEKEEKRDDDGFKEKGSFDCYVHVVRDVAPRKVMLCVSFALPMFPSSRGAAAENEGAEKKEEDVEKRKKQKVL